METELLRCAALHAHRLRLPHLRRNREPGPGALPHPGRPASQMLSRRKSRNDLRPAETPDSPPEPFGLQRSHAPVHTGPYLRGLHQTIFQYLIKKTLKDAVPQRLFIMLEMTLYGFVISTGFITLVAGHLFIYSASIEKHGANSLHVINYYVWKW